MAKGYKIGNGGMLSIVAVIGFLILYSTGNLAAIGLKPGAVASSGSGIGAVCTTAGGQTYTITQPNYSCGVGLTLAINWQDPLAGSGLNAPVNTIYSGTTQIDSCTGSSSGSCNSGLTNYQTGQQLWDTMTLSLYPTVHEPFVVPPVPTSATLATSVNVPFYQYKTGAWSMSIIGTGGTVISTGQTYWWAADTLTSVTLSTTITETVNNEGWKSTYDFVNGIMDDLVLEINDGGGANSNSQYLQVTGPEYTSKQGVTNYWQYVLPDGTAQQVNIQPGTPAGSAWGSAAPLALTGLGTYTTPSTGPLITGGTTSGPLGSLSGASSCQLISTTNYGCTIAFNTVVSKGSLTAGFSITLTYKLWENYDPNYFAKSGGSSNPLSSGATGAASQVNIGSASTFTIVFKG